MKKIKIILGIIFLIGSIFLGALIGSKEYKKYKIEEQLKKEMNEFKVEIILNDKKTISIDKKTNILDYIKETNVTLEEKEVYFDTLGKKQIELNYVDKYNRKGTYKIELEVIDDVGPVLIAPKEIVVVQNRDRDLTDGIVCADFVSSKVKCEVEGEYDFSTLGEYKLKFKATDELGNITKKDFTLLVVEPSNDDTYYEPEYDYFKDIYNTHKSEKTMLGIDVSKWQGDIDFKAVKEAGAEFVIIRLGAYFEKEHGVDSRYEENVRKAQEAGLKIGLYYYSEASSIEEAKSCADFMAKNVNFKPDLPLAYDWEDWSYYNTYNLSISDFNKAAYAFLDRVKENGYEGMLYGSTNYLEKMWRPKDYKVWVAQYYKENQYEGKTYMWQITSSGKIPGIDGVVDIDILYLD